MRLASRLTLILVPFTLLLSLTRPSCADGPQPPTQGTLYLGQGQMLEAAMPRQLTLGEDVYQFSYQPGGLEIATVGEQRDGDALTVAVRLVGTRHGLLGTLMSETTHVRDDGQAVESDAPIVTLLAGWSGDGRFLMVQQSRFVKPEHPAFAGDFHIKNGFTLIDVGVTPYHLASVPLPDDHTPDTDTAFWWSPGRSRLLFAAQGVFLDGTKHYVADTFCAVYDPAQSRMTPVELNDGQFAVGWLDDTHLLLKQTKGGTTHFFTVEPATVRQTETAPPARLPSGLGEADPVQDAAPISPKADYLTLQDEPRLLSDPQQVASQHAHALWVRRTRGPKSQSALPVGLTPGQDTPHARWSPNGQQIAFIAHGDLFVTDLTTRPATPAEELGSREPVNCAEERVRAGSNLKQIGLAIFQYVQDHDETYPPAEGLAQTVGPYLKGDSLYTVGGHPFVYHAPADSNLAHMDSPKTTVLGTMDLPCATVTLYADGHVEDTLKGVSI